jgi:phospho-N-acetylmuramoyl-pentapeptide-transferase
MLHYLSSLDAFKGLGLSEKAELRAICAALTAFLLVLFVGRRFIRFMTSRQVLDASQKGDSQRLDDLHAHKSKTPTLGGVALFSGVILSTLLWADMGRLLSWIILGYLLGLAALGFVDDFVKLKSRRKGISARAKLAAQVVLSLAVGVVLYLDPPVVRFPGAPGEPSTCLFFPWLPDYAVQLGLGFIALQVLVTTGSSNAVNLTDGLDGLAAGTSSLVALGLAVLAFLCGHQGSSEFLRIPYVESGLEVGVFLSALVGGTLGFLWFNCHPAQIFMGDTGALPLGGALGLAAVLCKQEILLVCMGGVLVAEALSVILQVASFKLRGKRIFLIAPLHHHFQFKGWSEAKITVRFWIAGAILATLSLLTLGIR